MMEAFILAEAPAIPITQWWMVGFGAVATCVSMLTLFATRRDLESAQERIAALEDGQKQTVALLRDMEARLSKASEDRAVMTHERINEVLKATSTIAGRMEGVIEQLRDVSREQHKHGHG